MRIGSRRAKKLLVHRNPELEAELRRRRHDNPLDGRVAGTLPRIVLEIGIANKRLTGSRRATKRFLRAWQP